MRGIDLKKVYDPKTGILNENDSILYLYEGSEVELELNIKNDDTVSMKNLYYHGLGKKMYSKSFNDDGTLESERIYHQDILGNNILLTDSTGGWVEKTTYGPFGDIISEKRRSPSSSIQHPTSYKFTGKERDKESNLDYFGARYLDYNNGRWMKPDLVKGNISNPQSLNRWIYVENNPCKYIDKIGYSAIRAHLNTAGQAIKYKMQELNDAYLKALEGEITWHYERNDIQDRKLQKFAEKEGIDLSNIDLQSFYKILEDWRTNHPYKLFEEEGMSPTHNIGMQDDPKNISFRATRYSDQDKKAETALAGIQLVFNSQTGKLVTDPINMGTYDFGEPGTSAHIEYDVKPWIRWGNSAYDTSTIIQRGKSTTVDIAEWWVKEQVSNE